MAEAVKTETAQTETTTEADVDYKQMWENERKEKELTLAKNQELQAEKKKIAQKAEDAEIEKAKLREEKLLKDGKYDELHKSALERERIYKERTEALENERAAERVKNEAIKLAAQLADGYNAELLTEFLVRRIKYKEGEGIKVLDANLGETVSSLDDLKREFQTSDKYRSLLRGSKASGGNASGSGSNSGGDGLVTKSEFDSWKDTRKKMTYMTTYKKFKEQQ